MRVIVGLGNPGRPYARTRHNVGARAVERLAARWGMGLRRRNPHALLGEGTFGGERVALALPRTYMNASGVPVAYLVRRFRIPLGSLLVAYDDLDLPLGTIRLRPGGGPGGHNGIASIIAAVGSEEVPRLRIGIGRPPPFVDPVAYVLGGLSPQEEAALERVWPRVEQALEAVVTDGLGAAMGRFNAAPATGDGPQDAEGEA